MPSRFDEFVQRVLAHEGGYTHNPADPGGATNFGITQRVARAHGYTGDMRDFPRAKAIEIYRSDYWTAIRGDELPAAVAWQLLDYAVNSGPKRAIQALQEAVGVTADGIFGPRTLAAANATSPTATVMRLIAGRLQFNTELGSWATFGKGWARRAATNLGYGAKDLS